VFGVLKVIFRRDGVAALRFGASQIQVALIIPLRILRLPREAVLGGPAFP
jgi:hypothetical protein